MARWVPAGERTRLALVVLPDAPAPAASGWGPACSRAATAQTLLHRAATELKAIGDLETACLSGRISALAEEVAQLRALLAGAKHHDLAPCPEEDPGLLQGRLAVHRARIVDAELEQVRPEPAPAAGRWSIGYRPDGGFTAHRLDPDPSGRGPLRGWGTAPTPASAAYTLASCLSPQVPEITVTEDPPASGALRPRYGAVALPAGAGVGTDELVAAGGPCLEEHLAAVEKTSAELASLSDKDLQALLGGRAAALDARSPQVEDCQAIGDVGEPRNPDHWGRWESAEWVPTRLVVATWHPRWGRFGDHRPEVSAQIAAALREGPDPGSFTEELFVSDEIHLVRIPGWEGPVYAVGANGNHRVHTAALLGLPWLAASVSYAPSAPSWSLPAIVEGDPVPDEDQPWPVGREEERAALVAGLIRRGVVEGELIGADSGEVYGMVLRARRLPAPWLLRAPELAVRCNAVYERCYPGALARIGIPEEVGTGAQAWRDWLTR
ncbi:hypothetical protein J0910_31085 [Nocardiopsis sp. CNT-189]|uniref:hypothetical protein n=1 Tax=Nocardiopsis oceanisediminis TaxID=2816862 RepID=UPI003B3526F3